MTILRGDWVENLKTLPDCCVQCCITSPPYWGLRDYGVAGQLGLEKTPEEYVEKMVIGFREVKRVLKDDGTLWLNLGTSYAGSWGDSGHRPERTGEAGHQREKNTKWMKRSGHPTGPKPPTVVACDKNSTRSPLLQRVPACGTDDREFRGSQAVGRAYSDSYGEPQADIQNHHENTFRSGLCASQVERPILPTSRDSERLDCDQEPLAVLQPDAQVSTIEQFSFQPQVACDHEATASVSLQEVQTSPFSVQESEHRTVCTSGTSQILPPLVVRTVGKESFFSACGDTSCKGIGRCGLCWCKLAIISLNVKAKDEINIPHLVAMALQSDGWFLRQTIVWSKPNPMPESVTDRCTKSHEYIFLLSKSARYYYDAGAIKERQAESSAERALYGWNGRNDDGSNGARTGAGIRKMKESGMSMGEAGLIPLDGMRNKRSVWTITTKPYKEAHFATFPEEIPRTCILAGSKKGDTILDPFSGAGTTGVVAEKLGRKYIGIELNPQYIKLAEDRIYNVQPLFAGLGV